MAVTVSVEAREGCECVLALNVDRTNIHTGVECCGMWGPLALPLVCRGARVAWRDESDERDSGVVVVAFVT